MDVASFVYMMTKIIFGGIATFFAVLVWSKTRDIAWILIVIGTIVYYIGIIYDTLDMFGIVGEYAIVINGISLVKLILSNLPMVIFVFAFIIVVVRKRIPR